MIATLAFSLIAALLVYRAGRHDVARDPRLTIALLTSLTIFPLLAMAMPKIEVLPSAATVHGGASSLWTHWLIGIWLPGLLWHLLAALACAVHWYHPLVHWMARRFVIQSEFACDAAALNAGIPAKIYAHTLCDLAERMTPSPLAASMASEHALESRIRRIATSATTPKLAAVHIAVAILSLTAALAAATLDRKQSSPISPDEIQLRLTANPFPGN